MKNLNVYLNDHLASSVAALELIKHWRAQHECEPRGNFLGRFETDIRADQDTLRQVMRSLAIDASTVRQTAAWAADNRD